MFSKWRNDRRRCIGHRAAADRLKDRDNAAGIVDIAANVIPSQTTSWMETGVTLFLEDKFQRGSSTPTGEAWAAAPPTSAHTCTPALSPESAIVAQWYQHKKMLNKLDPKLQEYYSYKNI